jgi:target of EGR1 protein 1
MFPAGIYDTKFIAEYVERERASYLAYLYRKYEREQMNRQRVPGASFVSCEIQDQIKVAIATPSAKSALLASVAHGGHNGSIGQKRKPNVNDTNSSGPEVCQKYAVNRK